MKTAYLTVLLTFLLSLAAVGQTFNVNPTTGNFGVGSYYGFNTYTNNMEYTWNIDLQDTTKFVRVSIEYFIEGYVWDYITVYSCDSNFSNLSEIVTVNINYLDTTIIESNVRNGKMVVKFVSDGSVSESYGFRGFTASATGVSENTVMVQNWHAYSYSFSTEKNDKALIINSLGGIGFGKEPFGGLFNLYRDVNPNFVIQSPRSSFEIGLSTITGGYSHYADTGDVTIRTQSSNPSSLNLYLNTSSQDGQSRISFGDAGHAEPTMSVFNNGQVAIGSSIVDENAVLTVEGETQLNGNLDLGSSTDTVNLTVYGTINAREIMIEALTADFVFADEYGLANLDSVEAFIDVNKHLPGVPSAKHMTENGIGVARMNQLLLQKVEELTLYMIALKKQNELQQKELESLKNLVTP